MEEEDDYVTLSAVEHYAYCPRQVYLIHAEGQFVANRFTVEGDLLHRRVTEGGDETRPGVRICRSMHVVSHRLHIRGIADVVEFHGDRAVPVEYKRGGGTGRRCEHVQLALQAVCLEEMLHIQVPEAFIWHGKTRRREAVVIDQGLRDEATRLIDEARTCLAQPRAPTAIIGSHCDGCSLRPICLPAASDGRSITDWSRQRMEG